MKMNFDFSPLRIRFDYKKEKLINFVLNIWAIIGGIFMTLKIIESFIFSPISKVIKAKLNKLN